MNGTSAILPPPDTEAALAVESGQERRAESLNSVAHVPGVPTPDRRGSGRVVFLDWLRSAAIVLVMLHHCRHLDGAPEWFKWFALRGYLGVDIFFVLSGWLVGGQLFRSLRQQGRVSPFRFWIRRALRTWPLYFALLAMVLIAKQPDAASTWSMLFFLQNYTCPHEWLITWSLCIEEHFYLLLPLTLICILRLSSGHRTLVAAGLILVSPALR